MCELLVKAVDASHVDAETDRRGCYKKGDVVLIKPDGWSWGLKEGPPLFVIVQVPGVSVAGAEQYASSWRRLIDYEVIATNAEGWRIRVFCTEVSVGGDNGLTRDQVEIYLTSWGAVVQSVAANEVVFYLPNTVDLEAFKVDVKEKVEGIFTRRKYYFSAADVDTALGMGGVIELTAAQVTNRINSKLDL